MAAAEGWLLAVLVLILALGGLLRRRYGNLYQRLGTWIERRSGWPMTRVVLLLGAATLVAWAAVYLLFGTEEGGLERLVPGLPGQPPEAAGE